MLKSEWVVKKFVDDPVKNKENLAKIMCFKKNM